MERPERHFEKEEERLKETILRLGSAVEAAIVDAIRALVERDPDIAREVLARDEEIDQLELEIDRICTDIIALYQPAARDLRFIIAALKIAPELERIGDLAGNISERAIELCEEPQLKPFIDIPLMARRAQEMVRGALDAFVQRDAAAARAVIQMDDELDDRMEQVFRELLSFMVEDTKTTTRCLRLMFVAKYFERMGDQATNIGEQIVFMAEGRVIKHPSLSSER